MKAKNTLPNWYILLLDGGFGHSTVSPTRILIFSISFLSQPSRLRYHSRCGDQLPQPPTAG